MKVSRSVKELAYKIQQVREILTARLGRAIRGEIAAELS